MKTKSKTSLSPGIWYLLLMTISLSAFGQKEGSWSNYGNDPGGSRYAPWSQINKDNVENLTLIWSFRTGELETYEGTRIAEKAAFESTPIMVDSVLYFSTPTNRIFAIHAESGNKIWSYDPMIDKRGGYSEITSRGVSKWIDSSKHPNDPDYMRIIATTIDGRMISLDARTGQPVTSFGENGQLDLKQNVGRIQFTSPPAVIGDLIITGSTMGDNQTIGYPRGVVRAIDARTGKIEWTWDPIPSDPDDPAFDTWKGAEDNRPGAANAWAPLSVDVDRDLVFIPTSAPSTDYYGGERIGTNLYANSLVALRASTGEYMWHFQAVHHDIWDYDIPAQPLLAEISREGDSIPAVIILTKMGHIFAFHRESGKPIFPIEERKVPESQLEGETAYPTQPFPAQLPLLGLREIHESEAWGPTAELEAAARKRISAHLSQGIFTPPSTEGSIMTPGNVGGMNWSGASFHKEKQLLITNVNNLPALITMHPRSDHTVQSVNEKLPRAEIGRQEGTPYIMTRDYLMEATPAGDLFIQVKPPWGTLAAIDMKSGTLKWEVPLGIMMDPAKYPGAENWGSINLGGCITSAGGLVFISGAMDNMFRAFDIDTGEVLWQYPLPAGGQATPMSYFYKGKQYIVICAGGHGKASTKLGDYVMAFALP